MLEFIQVTAGYSNAVLVAILPQITEFSDKLNLPVPLPVTAGQVERFNCDPHKGQVGGALRLTNGFEFWYYDGYVKGFASPDCWYGLGRSPAGGERFYGEVKLGLDEAVQLARDSLRRLGYPLPTLYADGTPEVTKPPRVHSKLIPRYDIRWPEPAGGGIALELEVDGEHGRLKGMMIINNDLARDPPPVTARPLPLAPGQAPEFLKKAPPQLTAMYHQMMPQRPLTPEQQHTVLLAILPLISDYARKLRLPISLPVTTNHVGSFDPQFFPGQTYVTLTNSYRFVYADGYICQFHAPYAFFVGGKRDGRIEDYWGRARMSEPEAIELARDTIRKLGYSLEALHLGRRPEIKKPLKIGDHAIPRYRLHWESVVPATGDEENETARIVSLTEVEVDAANKTVRSISSYDPSLRRPLPALDPPPGVPPNAWRTNRPSQLLFLTNAPAKPPAR